MENEGISIVMPCLNEEQTLGICINKARKALENLHGYSWEIIIADNGSTDKSMFIAESLGARVEIVKNKGYGNALRGGIHAAKYNFIIMGDADDSYDFCSIKPFIDKLEEGFDLVMGNRFTGGIEQGAMPWSHRYIGNPILSGLGRVFYRTNIGDFHCGMRAFRKDSIERINLCTTGMEFASEMVVKASLFGLKIAEVPCKLFPDGRNRPPHLRSIPDGLRHLRFLLIYSPRWLFLYPGFLLTIFGALVLIALFITPIEINNIRFETITMFYASMTMLLGVQSIQFSLFTNIYGRRIGQFPEASSFIEKTESFMKTKGFVVSILLIIVGIFGVIISFMMWSKIGYGEISDHTLHRWSILFGTVLVIGFHLLLSSFFVSVLHMGSRE